MNLFFKLCNICLYRLVLLRLLVGKLQLCRMPPGRLGVGIGCFCPDCRHIGGLLLRTLLHIVGITALILSDHSVSLKCEDPRRDTIQKIAVMGHCNDDSLVIIQIILQNGKRLGVQIVGRLI